MVSPKNGLSSLKNETFKNKKIEIYSTLVVFLLDHFSCTAKRQDWMPHCCWKMAVDPKSRWRHQRLYRLGLKYKSLKHKKDYFRLGLVECQSRFNLNIGRCFEKPFGLFWSRWKSFLRELKRGEGRRTIYLEQYTIRRTIYCAENNIHGSII